MAASRALNDQFRMLFEGAPNGVMAVDAAGCIIQLNAQIEKMFGYSREELIGRPAEVLVPVRFRQGHAGLRKKFAAAPQMRPMGTGRDLLGARKDESEFPVEVGLNSMATSMGDIFIATVVDITERKRVAEENNLLEQGAVHVLYSDSLSVRKNGLGRIAESDSDVRHDLLRLSYRSRTHGTSRAGPRRVARGASGAPGQCDCL